MATIKRIVKIHQDADTGNITGDINIEIMTSELEDLLTQSNKAYLLKFVYWFNNYHAYDDDVSDDPCNPYIDNGDVDSFVKEKEGL